MSKHTPGPWGEPYYDDYPGDEGWWILNGKTGMDEYAICVVFTGDPKQEADAYLITAAPDLLAALEVMVSVFRPREEPGPDAHVENEAWAKAASAIAKAKGEEANRGTV